MTPEAKSPPESITISLSTLARAIDHCLPSRPTLSDDEVREELLLARDYKVAAVCVNSSSIKSTWTVNWGASDVNVCGVASSPSPAPNDIARDAMLMLSGMAREIDMVIDTEKILSGEWDYIEDEIRAVKRFCDAKCALLKVIIEDTKLQEEQIIRICKICTREQVAFIGMDCRYTRSADGTYGRMRDTLRNLNLIKKHIGAAPFSLSFPWWWQQGEKGNKVQIKVISNAETLDELLYILSLGVTRVGTSSTKNILEEAKARGIGQAEVEVEVKNIE